MLTTSDDTLKKNPGTIYHSTYSEIILKEVCSYGKLHNAKKLPQLKKKKLYLAVKTKWTSLRDEVQRQEQKCCRKKQLGVKAHEELSRKKVLWKALAYLCGACVCSRCCLNRLASCPFKTTSVGPLDWSKNEIWSGRVDNQKLRWFCAISLGWMYCELEVIVILFYYSESESHSFCFRTVDLLYVVFKI